MASSTPATTTNPASLALHLGPEWMRTGASSVASSKHLPTPGGSNFAHTTQANGPSTGAADSSSTFSSSAGAGGVGLMTPAPSGMNTNSSALPHVSPSPYSSLLTPAPTTHQPSKLASGASETDPFRYGREDFLTIWRAGASINGGPGWRLGIEVERHDGVVVDAENIPACAREMTEAEIKLHSTASLNSRRGSLSHGGRGERDSEAVGLGILGRRGTSGDGVPMVLSSSSSFKANGLGVGPTSPLRERFSRRSDHNGTTQPYRPRQLASTPNSNFDGGAPLISPRTPSSGFGFGGGPGFDGVLNAGEGWGGRRRLPGAAASRQASFLKEIHETPGEPAAPPPTGTDASASHEVETRPSNGVSLDKKADATLALTEATTALEEPAFENWEDDPEIATVDVAGEKPIAQSVNGLNAGQSASPPDPAEVQWQYIDDQQLTQGPFMPQDLTTWEQSGWLRADLRMNRPKYDELFLPLSAWKLKMADLASRDSQDRIFYTWFEPILEQPPSPPKVLKPPPGLTKQTLMTGPAAVSEPMTIERQELPKQEAPPPSVFEALKRADQSSSTPSPVLGEGAFNHSPVSSHRLPGRTSSGVFDALGTHSSSPASSTANIYADSAVLSNLRAQHSQVAGTLAFYQGMNYPQNASIMRAASAVAGSSPIVGFNSSGPYPAVGGEHSSIGMQPPYPGSQIGSNFGGLGLRKQSYDQYQSPSNQWQNGMSGHGARGSNFVSGMGGTGMVQTNSTTSSVSNLPYAQFGGRRSPSPAHGGHGTGNIAVTSSLGGEVYEGTLGNSNFSNPIGRIPSITSLGTGGFSPALSHRSPVPPIPETAVILTDGGDYDLVANPSKPPVSTAIDAVAQPAHVPEKPDPAVIPAYSRQHESGIAETPTSTVQTKPAIEQHVAFAADDNRSTADEKTLSTQNITNSSATEEEDSHPFIQVKKRSANTVNPTPTTEPIVSTTPAPAPSLQHQPAKMTVPLASLITNPPLSPTPATPSVAPAKAWATVAVRDEPKGLKEIQEAEAKKARENERKARPSAPAAPSPSIPGKEDEVSVITWGLPTSKAGTRTAKDAKETSATQSPSVAAPAVWAGSVSKTAVPTTTKKAMTMKDIQEEEEKRKKKEREVVTVAKRIAEKPPTPAAVAVSQGVWSTVGPSGKATRPSTGSSTVSSPAPTGIAALPPRPSAAAIASSGMRAAHNANAANSLGATPAAAPSTARRPATATPTSAAGGKSTGKASLLDDSAYTSIVSADTLKWMKETLKGRLVKGTSVEEVVGLVLVMQEEDDIADTIYQCSTTLPGKRFAAEFIEKRNADKTGGLSTAGASSSTGPARATVNASSGTDSNSTKLQPIGTQDASGFKVVKKKGRGGKA